MKLKKILFYLAFKIAIIANIGMAKNNHDIFSYKGCPKNIISGIYLDGGTALVKVITDQQGTLYFGLENPSELSIWNSKKLITNDEIDYIKSYKTVKVFVNALSPKKENAKILKFKGEKENELKELILSWLKCDSIIAESKKELTAFIKKMDFPRYKKIVYEFDVEDEKLEHWIAENSPSNLFGNENNRYLAASVIITRIESIKHPFLKNQKGEYPDWLTVKLEILHSYDDKDLNGSVIALKKSVKQIKQKQHKKKLVILSYISDIQIREATGADYYLHEISEPETVYCFKNKIRDISKLGKESDSIITFREKLSWEKQCVKH